MTFCLVILQVDGYEFAMVNWFIMIIEISCQSMINAKYWKLVIYVLIFKNNHLLFFMTGYTSR